MPELPEVEVTRRRLAPKLCGRTIAKVGATAPSYFFLTPPQTLRRALPGRRIGALTRRGKYLLLEFAEAQTRLLLHLGMTGQLFCEGAASPRLLSAAARGQLAPEAQAAFRPDSHTHLRVAFADGGPMLFFRDVRKFGKVQLLRRGESCARLAKLGEDALRLSGAGLYAAAQKRRAPVKQILLDQKVAAGSGNIYADEALFWGGVRPLRAAHKVSRGECAKIAAAMRRVMRRAIATGGSSINDYIAPDGGDGAYQDERRVYARGGEPCRKCNAKIRRVKIGARSAHYCPRCQR